MRLKYAYKKEVTNNDKACIQDDKYTTAHYCIKRSIFAHWVLDESGDFVCYFKTVFVAFYGKRLW